MCLTEFTEGYHQAHWRTILQQNSRIFAYDVPENVVPSSCALWRSETHKSINP